MSASRNFAKMPILSTQLMIYILLGLLLVLVLWIIRLEIRFKRLMSGKNGKSLEDSINALKKSIEDLKHFQEDSIEYFKSVERRLKRSIQAIETVRFNPFKGTGSGGNQSFSTAIMSERGDGVVFSSLYSRDHVSVFSKPVKKFDSEFEMTEEEKGVVQKAKENLSSVEKN